jgi:hypothetical protein
VLVVSGIAVVWPTDDDPAAAPSDESARPDFSPVAVTGTSSEGLTLKGVVLDARGQPVADAEVLLAASAQKSLSTVNCGECGLSILSCRANTSTHLIAEWLSQGQGTLVPGATARTDNEGRFQFEHLQGVSFTVWAKSQGLGVGVRERAAPGESATITLPAVRSLSGTVEGPDGRGVSGARVIALSRRLAIAEETTTRADGSFEVSHLGEGPFYLLAEAQGLLPVAIEQVEAGSEPLRLALIAPRRLEVTVTHRGKPVEANVRILGDHLSREAIAKNGKVEFTQLYPDEVVVMASAKQLSSAPRTLSLESLSTELTLELEAGGTVAVTVVDE